MAYESDDIRPPVRALNMPGEKTLTGASCEDSKSHEASEPTVPNLRPADGDLYPKQPSPRWVAISRPPDFAAGNKNDADHLDGEANVEQEKTASPVLSVITWGLVGGLALWLYFQLVGLFKTVLEYHGWRLAVASVLFAIPIVVLLFVAIKAWKAFRKLPNRKQVRGDLCTNDISKKEELKGRLKQYVDDLQKNKNYASIFKSEERQRVLERINRLSCDSLYSDAGGWIDDFKQFHKDQEDRAYEIVKTYCKLVALKTAACPWKAIDMVIVFVNLTLMVEKIATVYNRRVSKGGAFRLLIHWFANIYISGELGAISERASDKVADWLTSGDGVKRGVEAGASVAEVAAEQAAGSASAAVTTSEQISDGAIGESLAGVFSASLPILSRFVGKAAEGAINAYFAYRMGKRAIEEFQFFVQSDNGR